MGRYVNVALAGLVVVALITAAFVGGALYASRREVPIPAVSPGPAASSVQLVREARDIVKRQALKPTSEESMTAGALSGLLESLDDPYAMYLDKRHYGYFEDDNAGELQGIGVTITKKGKAVVIDSVIKDTPALRSGIRAGDEVVSIDRVKKAEWEINDVVKRIRGKAGTRVALEMRRGEAIKRFVVTRARIRIPNIETEIVDGSVGYIRLNQFTEKAADEVADAVRDLERKGAKALVLDLRDNPGGLLEASVDVASLFIDKGAVVRIDSRSDGGSERTTTRRRITTEPLVVLINENSASASEIVAGALQDHRRAKLVGMKTYGKGSVQDVEALSNGGAVKLTVAHYLTPKGRVIEHKGLKPDVKVKMDPMKQSDRETDVQFHRAVRLAKSGP